ncbi:MAG: bacillithiol biosynthesis cysteine-adding enzyme BshC [Acidobacteriota bacterium]|nr:bacillithiol biosynthesis cysteine-adding enzyme BshC [Acidobacteriota bacterium]
MATADCTPITVAPGASRLFQDFCSGTSAACAFYPIATGKDIWFQSSLQSSHIDSLVAELGAQNTGEPAKSGLEILRAGGGAVVTGQQVGLFGGPLYTPLKAATALARARQATAAGRAHAAIFWLATEDHDFAEINHVTFPGKRELATLKYGHSPAVPVPVGGVVIDQSISQLIDQAWELLGYSDAMEALAAAYKPGRTFAQAFAEFYSKAFAAQGLLVIDPSTRGFHALGAPVLRAAIERADELHASLLERNEALVAAGYHAQVAVGPQSSLLFLLDATTGARVALKRQPPTAEEPDGIWMAGRDRYSTADLLQILAAEPERISPSALLRPVFQDFLLGNSLTIGGPAEVAYFAQSAVLYEKILGRMTPVEPRLSATLIEPAIAELLRTHELTLERVIAETPDSLAQLLAARAMPIEGKRLLSAAGNALDAELDPLLAWMRSVDEGLGRSGETSARKMRYQMGRLRRMAANFQLKKEESLRRHADAICQALFPHSTAQERVHGAAFYFARHGFELAEQLTEKAAEPCPGHTLIWL